MNTGSDHPFGDAGKLLGQFTAFMEAVVNSARVDYLRRRKRYSREIPAESAPVDENMHYEDPIPRSAPDNEFDFEERRLSDAFSKLNLMRRKILTLIFVEGLPAQEVAERLNCSVDYVYLQKHRALKTLRDQLMDGGEQSEKH